MSGWYLFNKYRQTSIRLTILLLVIIMICIVIKIIFPSIGEVPIKKQNDSTDIPAIRSAPNQ